jgi:parallel beta-helix repeat protein
LNRDTIKVDANTYYESVNVNKSLTLVGEDRDTTVIDGNGSGVLTGYFSYRAIIEIQANYASISGFTVKNAGLHEGQYDFHACIICMVGQHDIEVENNTLQEAGRGIVLISVSQVNISNNDISNMLGYGIDVGISCTNVTVNDSHIHNYGKAGISLDGSTHYCRIINNAVENGVLGIILSPNVVTKLVPIDNLIDGNILSNNSGSNIGVSAYSALAGFQQQSFTNVFRRNNLTNSEHNNLFVWGDSLASFMQDIDSSNIANGKRIYYLTNTTGLKIDSSSYPDGGYFALVNCSHVNVKDFNFSGNEDGLLLAGSVGCVLTNLTLRDNRIFVTYENQTEPTYWGGLIFFESNNNTIENCVFCNSTYGAWLYHSDWNLFTHNSFIGNDKSILSGDIPTIALPSGYISTNFWDDGYSSGGNYWSDYNGTDLNQDGIGDTPYTIDTNNIDHYPLMGIFNSFNVTSQCSVETVCNSTISDFQFNGTAISFNVSDKNDTIGFCRISIPTALINGALTVFVNETEVPYTLLPESDRNQSSLYFTYHHSIQQVIITMPEFPSFLVMPLFMIATILAVIVYKKKGILTSEEWEREVKMKVETAAKTTKFLGDRILSEAKKCPKCGGEMEGGAIIYAWNPVRFLSNKAEKPLIGRAGTQTIAYSCKACGYVEIYRKV